LDVANRLAECRLMLRIIVPGHGREYFTAPYRLNVNQADVDMALGKTKYDT